jgi:hypothetical protein
MANRRIMSPGRDVSVVLQAALSTVVLMVLVELYGEEKIPVNPALLTFHGMKIRAN